MKFRWLFIIIASCAAMLSACSGSDSQFDLQHTQGMGSTKSLIEISSPINGAILPKDTPFILDYAVVRGRQGDYVKIQIDNKRPITIIGTKGEHHIDGLPAGKHTLTITEYSSDKKPTGGQASITITMQ